MNGPQGSFLVFMNLKDKILLRQKVNGAVRSFFNERGYLEVETPRFVPTPDMEPTLSHFESTVEDVRGNTYGGGFITSPEYALKKTVSVETPRIFELARVFRNSEPFDALHNPEFTMLEWYSMGSTIDDGIQETIQMIAHVARTYRGKEEVIAGGRTISVAPSDWQVHRVEDLFRTHCGMDTLEGVTKETYQAALDRLDQSWEQDDTIGDLFQRLMLNYVEPWIAAQDVPIIVRDYPAHEATLAQLDERGFAERFEVYVGGIELCNGYGELTDAREQRARFVAERRERQRLGKTLFPIDELLIEALHHLDGPLFGNGFGLDRLMMLVAGHKSIQDVLLFPATTLFTNE